MVVYNIQYKCTNMYNCTYTNSLCIITLQMQENYTLFFKHNLIWLEGKFI